MSSRSKKTRQQTPEASTSFTSPGRNRPPSPIMIARVQEKAELACLNDRLAAYIDRVRQLETDNSRLVRQVQTQEDTVTREVSNIKSLYETELADARRLLDETAKQKAKLQIEVGKYKAEAVELREKYAAKERELHTIEKRLHGAEAQVNDLQARLNDAINQRKQWEAECNKLRKQVDALEKQLATAKRQLEEETILRVDLENRLQSLKEELAFSRQLHSQELNESRSRTTIEIEEVDSRIQHDYDARLADALRQLREENDAQIKATRDEAEAFFQRKLSQLKAMAMAKDGMSESARKELNESRRRIEDLQAQLSKVNGQLTQYEMRVRELEALLKRDREEHEEALNMRDLEIRRLREAIEDQMSEYRDLLDIKIQLDLELVAYRKLLEGEETRLNITAEGTPGKTPHRATPIGSRKRKRMAVSHQGAGDISHLQSSASSAFNATSSAAGPVEICEVDPAGQYIKIHNTSDKDVSVGSWQLKHIAKDEETTYKYHRNINIKAGQYITVWSSESETTHSPPSDLVMKGQKWFVADSMRTVLLNNQGEEIAMREMERTIQRRSTYTSSLGEDIVDSGYEVGSEEVFHQQGDPNREDRCSLM